VPNIQLKVTESLTRETAILSATEEFPLMFWCLKFFNSEELKINNDSEPNNSAHVRPHYIFLEDAILHCGTNTPSALKRSLPFKIIIQNLHGFLNSAMRDKPTCPHHVMLRHVDHPVKFR
jgi:hypothetical protein